MKLDWATGLDDKGRPMRVPGKVSSPWERSFFQGSKAARTGLLPSSSPKTDLFYLNVWDDYSGVFFSWNQEFEMGKLYSGGRIKAAVQSTRRDR